MDEQYDKNGATEKGKRKFSCERCFKLWNTNQHKVIVFIKGRFFLDKPRPGIIWMVHISTQWVRARTSRERRRNGKISRSSLIHDSYERLCISRSVWVTNGTRFGLQEGNKLRSIISPLWLEKN